jgi:hypothetical protein
MENLMKVVKGIRSRFTMRITNRVGFVDVVSGGFIHYYKDYYGDEFMVEYPCRPWSFRVKCNEGI